MPDEAPTSDALDRALERQDEIALREEAALRELEAWVAGSKILSDALDSFLTMAKAAARAAGRELLPLGRDVLVAWIRAELERRAK